MKAGLKADFELSVLKSWWWGISVRGDGNLIHLCPKGEGHSSSASHLSEYLSSDWSTDFKPNMIGWGNIGGRGVDIKKSIFSQDVLSFSVVYKFIRYMMALLNVENCQSVSPTWSKVILPYNLIFNLSLSSGQPNLSYLNPTYPFPQTQPISSNMAQLIFIQPISLLQPNPSHLIWPNSSFFNASLSSNPTHLI